MESFFNQYSYVLISLAVIVASTILLRRYAADSRVVGITLISLIAFSVTGFFLLRPGKSDIDSAGAAQAALENGKPTFIEFFSNYCASCLALRPSVDLLVSVIKEDYNVLRIDIHTDFGRELRQNFEFTYTPEFILFDASGTEVWRGHTLPQREQVFQLAPDLLKTSTITS